MLLSLFRLLFIQNKPANYRNWRVSVYYSQWKTFRNWIQTVSVIDKDLKKKKKNAFIWKWLWVIPLRSSMCNNEQGKCKCVLYCEQRIYSYAKPQKNTSKACEKFGIKATKREKKETKKVNLQHIWKCQTKWGKMPNCEHVLNMHLCQILFKMYFFFFFFRRLVILALCENNTAITQANRCLLPWQQGPSIF